jgi:carbamoyl-phosphate synthase large subunit
MRTISVSGASGDVAQGVLKGLRESEHSFRLIALDASEDSAGFYLADAGERVPRVDDPHYVEALVEVLDRNEVVLHVPTVDSEIPLVARARGEIESRSGARVLVANAAFVLRAVDKLECQELLADARLPRLRTTGWGGNPDAIVDAVGLPLIVKPRTGHGSRGVHEIGSRAALADLLPDVDETYCFQEYVSGPEYTCSLLYDRNGALRDAICLRRVLASGTTVRAEPEMPESVRQLILRFGEAFHLLGSVNLQLRISETGPRIFEINPRFSGTTGASLACGFNGPARIAENLLLGREIEPAEVRRVRVFRILSELVVPLEE